MMTGAILDAEVAAQPAAAPARRAARLFHWAEQMLLGLAGIFFALHFVHLRADFPNHSPWMDWAKYTDEGWYGDAAIRHHLWGHWRVPGDFNPAAALPVWPAIELVLFRFTGVSLVAARALTVVVFGLILIACYRLLRGWAPGISIAPALAVLLLAASPFCYAFTRLAILEPLLVLLTLCGLLLARRIGAESMAAHGGDLRFRLNRRLLPVIALGLVLPAIMLTKTTGLFLFPAILFALWGAARRRAREFTHAAAAAGAIAAAVWIAYYLFFVRPQFLTDYRYLFSANSYSKITLATLWPDLQETLMDATWIGDALFWSSLIALAGWLVAAIATRFRGSWLPTALALWVLGYAAFLAYHANFAPRYYLVIAVPLTLLLAMGFDALLRAALTRSLAAAGSRVWFLRIAAAGSSLTLLAILVSGCRQIVHFALHPEYSFLTAVHRLHDAVQRELAADPRHSSLVLSISGSDISLITGLPSICDDFGTMELPDRVAAYKPGWFAAWNDVEDDKMAALAPMYRLVKVGAYPAFDDPERNLLLLYRLDPLSSPRRGRSGRRRYFVSPHQRTRRPARAGAAVP